MTYIENTRSPSMGSVRNDASLAAVGAALILSACGGGGDGNGLQSANMIAPNAAASCAALKGTLIPSSSLGESSAGAVVTSANFLAAVADATNTAGTATVPGTPDYCRTLIDINPVDPTAPVIKVQVNMPVSWNRRSLQMGGGPTSGC